jgi:outer membrane protein OmpA-like peptidoglycan-associated protein
MQRIKGATGVASVAATVAMVLFLTGCTGESAKDRSGDAAGPGGDPTASSSAGDGKSLPVAGTVLYQMGDQGGVVARLAVHALRRTAQGTVLDWSITPLSATRATPGKDFTVGPTDLDSMYGYQSIDLVDLAGNKVYRPLLTEPEVNPDSLSRPFFSYSTDLRLGETSLFQLVFPPLPASLSSVAVAFNGGSVVPGVPVTPAGKVPTGGAGVDLAAPAPAAEPLAQTPVFTYPQGDMVFGKFTPQQMTIAVDQVLSYPGGTTLLWTVTTRTPTPDLVPSDAAPIGDHTLHSIRTALKSSVADGPGLRPAGADAATPTLRATYSTVRAKRVVQAGQDRARWQQCRCSDWQARARALTAAGRTLRFATTYPALPAGTAKVSVTFPVSTVRPLADVPVTAAPEAQTGAVTDDPSATWQWDTNNTAKPLTPAEWPVPLPDDASYAPFTRTVVDDLVLKTSTPAVRSERQDRSTTLSLDTRVLFGPDSATLLPAARAELARVARQLSTGAKDGSTVTVFGYVAKTDGGNSPAVAASLSTARAQAVYGVLKPLIRTNVRWVVEGKGFADPVAPNDNESDRRLNRRVEITYTG